jgi:hypothetical protein
MIKRGESQPGMDDAERDISVIVSRIKHARNGDATERALSLGADELGNLLRGRTNQERKQIIELFNRGLTKVGLEKATYANLLYEVLLAKEDEPEREILSA